MDGTIRHPARHLTSALVMTGGVIGAVLLFGAGVSRSWHGPLPSAPEAVVPEAPAEEQVGLFFVPDRFQRGDSLSDVLVRNGFASSDINEVAAALDPVADVRRLKAGQAVALHRDEQGVPTRIELPFDDLRQVEVVRAGDIWTAHERVTEINEQRGVVSGLVTTNLYDSIIGAGERADLAILMARALEYDIDFHRDTRKGDTFAAVVDKLYDDAGEWRGYGELRGVRYVNAGRPIFAFRFELPSGESGFYDYEGNSIQRTFLMSPVEYSRISGVFTSRRLHPVHKVYRPHYGVDYAAPHGTPVMATADGVVADAGNRGPNGIMVTLRHAGGYMTRYLHLSRIADAGRPGRRVSQRDIIGYVGSTGVSTGPHVDYRLYRYGKPLNPRTHTLPPGPPIPDEHRAAFFEWRDTVVNAFDNTATPTRPRSTADTILTTTGTDS